MVGIELPHRRHFLAGILCPGSRTDHTRIPDDTNNAGNTHQTDDTNNTSHADNTRRPHEACSFR